MASKTMKKIQTDKPALKKKVGDNDKLKKIQNKKIVKLKSKAVTGSKRAGLEFPVGRVRRYLRKGRYAERTSASASVFLAGVLEYMTAELLELTAEVTKEKQKRRITPRHILIALSQDEELHEFFKMRNVIIPDSGVIPHIQSVLQPPKKPAKNNQNTKSMDENDENTSEESGIGEGENDESDGGNRNSGNEVEEMDEDDNDESGVENGTDEFEDENETIDGNATIDDTQ